MALGLANMVSGLVNEAQVVARLLVGNRQDGGPLGEPALVPPKR